MGKTHIGQKMILSAAVGMIMIPGSTLTVTAAENKEEQPLIQTSGIESVLEECYETEVKDNINLYLVPTEEGEYLNMAFSDTGDYTYIRSAPDEDSDWVGKLYKDSAARCWNIWTAGQRFVQARLRDMFLQIRLLQEMKLRNMQKSMKIIRLRLRHPFSMSETDRGRMQIS